MIIDPYLSFYPSINENDNGEVRGALDRLKHEVLLPLECGAIISDHQTKYASQTPGQENQARGAGAKRDLAATLLCLKKENTPVGEHGTFLSITVDKLRYGPVPRDPIIIRKDQVTFRCEVWKSAKSIELHRIAELVDNARKSLSKNALQKAIIDSISISKREALELIDGAVQEGWLEIELGVNRSQNHNLGKKYIDWRDKKCSEAVQVVRVNRIEGRSLEIPN